MIIIFYSHQYNSYGILYGHYALFHEVNTCLWLQSEYFVVTLEN